jgi:hypothetical protein
MSDFITIEPNAVYAFKYGNTERDSTTLEKAYGIKVERVQRKSGKERLNSDVVYWSLVGRQPTKRTKLSGHMLPPVFRKRAIRKLEQSEIDALLNQS